MNEDMAGEQAQRVLIWLLVEEQGSVLLGRRKADGGLFAGQWVLPGEEMPAQESASETVLRFAREQLGVTVAWEDFRATLDLAEKGTAFAVNVFQLMSYDGRPRYRESGPYSEVRWVAPADAADATTYPMPRALREALTASERSLIR